MTDLENLQMLAQLIDNMQISSNKLEDAYNKNNAEKFNSAKQDILDVQKKIDNVLKK
jgi:hypothetical protein